MKKLLAFALVALLMVSSGLALAQDTPLTHIEGKLQRSEIALKKSYPDNAVIPGVSTTTGIPFDGVYAPVVIVVDNAEAAHPHWGVGEADVMYQVPNAGAGATKLLALFADHAPAQAGGVRSARTPFVQVVSGWGAAFGYAGSAGKEVNDAANVPQLLSDLGYRKAGLTFDLLGNNTYSERIRGYVGPHNLSAHISEIRDIVVKAGATFQPRGFLFTDAAQTAGVPAGYIELQHYGNDPKALSNPASASSFTYDEAGKGYIRANSSGTYVDRDAPAQPIIYANVIIQRTKLTGVAGGYVATKELVGSGAAEIFTGGKYIAGAWTRTANDSRTVFVDDKGEEIALQRGKTFIIITNDVTTVDYR